MKIITNGQCGENAFYVLTNDGTLLIQGNGPMNNFYDWEDYYEEAHPFKENPNIKNIIIKNGITYIGSESFSNCTSLKSVSIPDSVTSIGKYAFYKCNKLKEIDIPNSIETIEEEAFAYCSAFTKITLPESLIELSETAFYKCTSIIEVQWNSINYQKTINGENVFGSQITSFSFGEKVENIPPYLFDGLKNITNIVIPESIQSIGFNTFKGCSSLSTIICLSNTPPNADCLIVDSRTCKLIVPKSSVYEYQQNKQWNTFNIIIEIGSTYETKFDNNILKLGQCGDNIFYKLTKDGTLYISGHGYMNDEYDDYSLSPFFADENITTIIIEDTILSIGDFMFKNCKNLNTIRIPYSIQKIGTSAFENCTSLSHIIIPQNVNYIGDYAFNKCTSLKVVICEGETTFIDEFAFANCNLLQSIILPNKIETIKYSSFKSCISLSNIIIPNSVTSIESESFGYCTKLETIVIYGEKTTIDDCAFIRCPSLKHIIINKNIKLTEYAFDEYNYYSIQKTYL